MGRIKGGGVGGRYIQINIYKHNNPSSEIEKRNMKEERWLVEMLNFQEQ